MRHIRKYNESISGSPIEAYKSNHVSSVKLLRTTQENGFEIYEFQVVDVDGTKNKLVIDTSVFGNTSVRKARVYYPTTGAYFMDIDRLSDWRQIFKKIEEQANNRLLHKKRMDEVSKMFTLISKEVITDYFSDLIDLSISNQIKAAEDFDKPLYWELYVEVVYNISDGGNMLLDDKSREILDIIIVDTKRIESDFNVRTSVRISTMVTVKNPVIKICVFAKDVNGDAIGYKLS